MSITEKIISTLISDTEILSVTHEISGRIETSAGTLENLPPFCRVQLKMTPGSGSLIYTEVWLPNDWNGIFVGTGNGGIAGQVAYGWLVPFVQEGYAVANTDMGTSRGEKSGIGNPDVWKDFGWRATHLMTKAAKELIRVRYDRDPAYAYFVGSSTGGQQAMKEAQCFPEDYDGILAAVPANSRLNLHTFFLWNYVHLHTEDGTPMFSSEEISTITDSAVAFYQARGDGMPGDRFVSLPLSDPEVISDFLQQLRRDFPSFTEGQLSALAEIYQGPVDPATDKHIYCGLPIGSEDSHGGIWDCEQQVPPHFYPFLWTFGADVDPMKIDFDKDWRHLKETLSQDLDADSVELEPFFSRGGKLIVYSGSSDPWVPFLSALEYCDKLYARFGSAEAVENHFRYYLLPGRDHGGSGKGYNFLCTKDLQPIFSVLRGWREDGILSEDMYAVPVSPEKITDKPETLRPVKSYKP